ncbi:MAG: NAD(P)H-dependent oxidoreductase subunit E [Nitrospirae bacterium]|nr:MAG: NAD(P)H-dependent oxidoreductase subunit E [Nitrospirota bacterium]
MASGEHPTPGEGLPAALAAKEVEITAFPEALRPDCDAIRARYETPRAALMPVLWRFQREYGYISPAMERVIAEYLEIPLIWVQETVTFYTMYNRRPVGTYHVQVCGNLSCTLCGARETLAMLEEELGIRVGETTPDGRFTLSVVQCLAACEEAPMMQVNDRYHGHLTRERIREILGGLP